MCVNSSNKIKFPVEYYENHVNGRLSKFDYNSMILVVLSRYCYQLMISEIFGISFSLHQTYLYSFSSFEIADLSLSEKNILLEHKSIDLEFDFYLPPFNNHCAGTLFVDIKFVNNGTFENSFYKIDILIKSEEKIQLSPFFLTKIGERNNLETFVQKLWIPILQKLVKDKDRHRVQNNILSLKTALIDDYECILNKYVADTDLVLDVFYIVFSMFVQKDEKSVFLVSVDEIMQVRGLKKNVSSSGRRGGYKNIERQKVKKAIELLDKLHFLVAIEVSKLEYLVSIPIYLRTKMHSVLPKRLVQFNYKTQLWHRRFGFYIYKCRKNKIVVKEFFHLIKDLCSSLRSGQVRDRFEYVMDELVDFGLIKDWYYCKIDENQLQGKNWFEKWLRLNIVCRY